MKSPIFKNKIKNVILLFLIVALLASMLNGCSIFSSPSKGPSQNNAPQNSNTSTSEAAEEEDDSRYAFLSEVQ